MDKILSFHFNNNSISNPPPPCMCICPLLVTLKVGSLSFFASLLHIRTSCCLCLCLLSLSRDTMTETAHSSTVSSFFFLCEYHGLNSDSQDCMACAFYH